MDKEASFIRLTKEMHDIYSWKVELVQPDGSANMIPVTGLKIEVTGEAQTVTFTVPSHLVRVQSHFGLSEETLQFLKERCL